jgi:putative hydrolase
MSTANEWRDVNAIIFGLFRDLAEVQTERPKKYAYARSASVVFWLERPIDEMRNPDGSWPKIPGLGPSSQRIIDDVIATGRSARVEAVMAATSKGAGWAERVASRQSLLSRAGTLRALADNALAGPAADAYRGDFQMHSEWSDGAVPIAALAQACMARGYAYCAVTDHAKGLRIARGLTAEAVRRQHEEIDRLNQTFQDFRVLKGIEANLAADGSVDVSDEDRTTFDLVLAAPHANLRTEDDQTERLVRVIDTPGIHILAHPRGRKVGARVGIVADWDAVFRAAAQRKVAIEIDGDPSRQDLDHALARRALAAGCLFALDSDAHTPEQLVYAETAIAHARIAGIPAARVVNCWPLKRLLAWSRALRDR